MAPSAGEDEEKQLPFTDDAIAKWCSYFGRQFGGFSQNVT